MKLIEILISFVITIYIFSVSYPIIKGSNSILEILLRKREMDRILDQNFEKMKYDIEDAEEVKLFQKSMISYQLNKSFLTTAVEKGNMILLYLKEDNQYIVYINRKNYIERYIGNLSGSVIMLESSYEKILENIKSTEFSRQGNLIYITLEYVIHNNSFKRIDRVINILN